MDGDEVGLGHQLLQRHQRHNAVAGHFFGHIGIAGDDPHCEPQRPLGHQPSDPAQPQNSQRFVAQLYSLPARPLPPSVGQRGVGLGDISGLGQEQGHSVLGGRDDVGQGVIDHQHPVIGSRVHIHVVQAHPGPAHDHQLAPRIEHLGSHLGGRPDDQRLELHNRFQQLSRGQPCADIYFMPSVAELGQPAVGDLLGNQNPGHRPSQ